MEYVLGGRRVLGLFRAAGHTTLVGGIFFDETPVAAVPFEMNGDVAQSAQRTPRAFGKLLGRDFCCYLYGNCVVLGRQPHHEKPLSDDDDDAKHQRIDLLHCDRSVSRRHAIISYSSTEKHFELRVLGKNGLFVNGLFVSPQDGPVRLRSQSEIALGKPPNILTMTFLLPAAVRQIAQKRQGNWTDGHTTIVDRITEAILDSSGEAMTIPELVQALAQQHPELLVNADDSYDVLRNRIQHVLILNENFTSERVAKGLARWRVHPDYACRYTKLRRRPKPAAADVDDVGPDRKTRRRDAL